VALAVCRHRKTLEGWERLKLHPDLPRLVVVVQLWCARSHLLFHTSPLKLFALICALLWMIGLLSCAVWVGHSFTQENFKVLWPISVSALRL
jgi:hypothetical protein